MRANEDIGRHPATVEFGRIRVQPSRFRRAVERNISEQEVREAGAAAELIEDYPDDKYSPSALLLGFSAGGRALHFQVTFDETTMAKIVTIYEPDPEEWIDHRKRR